MHIRLNIVVVIGFLVMKHAYSIIMKETVPRAPLVINIQNISGAGRDITPPTP